MFGLDLGEAVDVDHRSLESSQRRGNGPKAADGLHRHLDAAHATKLASDRGGARDGAVGREAVHVDFGVGELRLRRA